MPGIKTFAFEAKGVGRKDYSSGIELSVEPVIRSYQDVWNHWDTVTILPGASQTINIALATGKVALLYDFYAQIQTNELIEMRVYTVTAGVAGRVVQKSKHGSIAEHLSKGFPFYEIVRFILYNRGENSIDFTYGAVGIVTGREEYFMQMFPQVP